MAARFRALDSCRGLCAVAVLLYHGDALTHFHDWPAIRNGWAAVDFFFTLSGFVLARTYATAMASWADAARFVLRRIGRLYPLHLAALGVYVAIELYRLWGLHAVDAFTYNTAPGALVQQLFLVQGFTAQHETWNYPAWSISVELWVNLAFAAIAVLAGRRTPWWVLGLLLCSGIGVAYGNAWPQYFDPALGAALQDALHAAFEFLLGFIAFLVFEHLQKRGWRPHAIVEMAAALLIISVFQFADRLTDLEVSAAFAAFVIVFAFEAGPVSQALCSRPLIALGTWSYSIYLTQSFYLRGVRPAVLAIAAYLGIPASAAVNGDDLLVLGGPWAMDAVALAFVALAIAGSAVTYRLIEEPARKYFNNLARANRAEATSPAFA